MKKIQYSVLLSVLVFLLFSNLFSQTKLKPGFDADEYAKLLQITARVVDTPWVESKMMLPYPTGYEMVYRSPTVGLDNRWDLWLRDDSVLVVSVRGTIVTEKSWLEDFYAPMVPATGSINAGGNKIFTYNLAEDTNAYVHTGFLLGLAYLAPDIVLKINEYYTKGYKEFILTGHSQGGGVISLLTSYLRYLPSNELPGDITFKTYAGAPPKPGNLFYCYDYDFRTRGGWGYRVINTMDWVPNMPVTVQTVFDYNQNNPFVTVDSVLSEKLNFIERVVVGLVEKSMFSSLDDARDKLIKYLGHEVYKSVAKNLEGFPEPNYSPTMYYMTCGSPVVLMPTAEYLEKFRSPGGLAGMFINHMPDAYFFLLNKWYGAVAK